MQLDFTRKRSTRDLRCNWNFDARPTRLTHSQPGTTQLDFQRENRRSTCCAGENSPHRPPERRRACHKPRIPRRDPGASENPATLRGPTTERWKSTHSRPCVETKQRTDPRNQRTPLCFHASPPLQPLRRFFTQTTYFVLERDLVVITTSAVF
ncbi:hypothetical protein NDU88_003156 [Pleurodeles waltl]|uniref:Uncharacterized protein n=1 Tax=Pleurodeles waltl TaxID=8319 RepID=A0AAV7T5R1_PLEWA|nr:hypothetical protein NDU88_003156 [Pleurodeles waltl]